MTPLLSLALMTLLTTEDPTIISSFSSDDETCNDSISDLGKIQGEWWVLHSINSKWRIDKKTIKLKKSVIHLENGEPQVQKWKIVIPGVSNPLCLISTKKNFAFTDGLVPYVPLKRKPFFQSPNNMTWHHFFLNQEISITSKTIELAQGKKEYRIIFSCGNRKQVIFKSPSMPGFESACPIWIGDLDGDGKPDLFITYSTNWNTGTNYLFLSSIASPNELIKLAGKDSYCGD